MTKMLVNKISHSKFNGKNVSMIAHIKYLKRTRILQVMNIDCNCLPMFFYSVNIYKCKYLADSCGSCILLDENYRCIWCETDKSCRHEMNSSICQANQIINSAMGICPDPRLRHIYPRTGPQYGQTPIHLFGSNLGKKAQDISVVLIHSNHTIYPCHIDSQSYIISQSFTCQPPSLPMGIYTIKVTVHSVVSKDRPMFHVVVRNDRFHLQFSDCLFGCSLETNDQ